MVGAQRGRLASLWTPYLIDSVHFAILLSAGLILTYKFLGDFGAGQEDFLCLP